MLTYNSVVKGLLFISFFIMGLPFDGQLGQFSAGSMYTGDAIAHVAEAKNTPKTNTIIIWMALYIVAFLIFIRRANNIFTLLQSLPLFIVFYVFLFISLLWSESPVTGAFELFQLLASILICSVVAIYYKNKPYELLLQVGIALGMAQLMSFILILVLPSLAVAPNGRWVGMYGAPNYLGALAFCSVWCNMAVLMLLKPSHKRLYLFLLIISLFNLFGTNSITSILCSTVALSGMFIWPYLLAANPRAYLNRLLLAILCMFLALLYFGGLIELLFYDIFEATGRSTNLSGRGKIWQEAFFAISQHFYLGHGYGTKLQLMSITRLDDLHSFYITLLYSCGFFGLTLFILSQLQVMRSMYYLNTIDPILCRIIVPMFIAILIYNFSETALFGPRSPIFWVFVLVMLLIQLVSKKRGTHAN